MIDGNFRVLKNALCIVMPHAQFSHLARTTCGRILVALAAGLRIVQRPESVRQSFYFLKFGLVGAVRRIVDHTITLVIESCGSLGKSWCKRKQPKC